MSWSALLALAMACVCLCAAPAAAQIGANYSVFFVPTIACDVTVDGSGSYYLGLCNQNAILKLNSQFQFQSTFDAQVASTLTSLDSNSSTLISFGGSWGISSTGVLWFNDQPHFRLLGISEVNPSQVLSIDTTGINGAWEMGVSPNSPNPWTTSLCRQPAGALQYAPNGTLLTSVGTISDPVGLPSTYCIMGVVPDNVGQFVYVGGCNLLDPSGIDYHAEYGYFYVNYTAIGQCDIRKVSMATLKVVQVLTAPALDSGYYDAIHFWEDMAVSPVNGDLYAADYWNGVAFHFNSSGQQVGNFSIAGNLAFTPAGNPVTLGDDGFYINVLSPSGVLQQSVNITSNLFAYPLSVATDPSGFPVYCVSELGTVAVFNSAGLITRYLGSNVLQYAFTLATDSAGNVYVTDYTNTIFKFSNTGQLLMNFTDPLLVGSYTLFPEYGMAVNPTNQQLLVPIYNETYPYTSGYIAVFSTTTGQLLQRIPAGAPDGVGVTSSGTIVWSDESAATAQIVVMDPSGTRRSFNSSNPDFEPWGLTVSPDGRIFIADENGEAIYSYNLQGQQLAVIAAPASGLTVPSLWFSTQGNTLWAVDLYNSRLITFPVGSYGTNPSTSDASPAIRGSTTAVAVLALASALVAMLLM